MIRLLPSLKPGLHLELLKREMAGIRGTDDELPLAQALHSNITYPFPTPTNRFFVPPVIDQVISTLHNRFESTAPVDPYPELKNFIIDVLESTARSQSKRLGYASDFATFLAEDKNKRVRVTHTWVRQLLTEGGWEMAAPLLYRLEDLPSGTSGGAKFNILSGVLLAVIDDDADRLNGVGQCIPSNRNDFHTSVLGSLAFLLHRNNFNSYGNWSLSGATEVLTAGAAWLIQTIGIVSRDDDHLEKRCIENLIPMFKSLGPSGVLWGIDRTAIEAGFANLHARCPELWRQHGRELERETGVELRAVPKSSSDFEHRVSGPRG